MKKFTWALVLMMLLAACGCQAKEASNTATKKKVVRTILVTPSATATPEATQTATPEATVAPTVAITIVAPTVTVTTTTKAPTATVTKKPTPKPTPKPTLPPLPPDPNKVRNVIFFIGDGMGYNHIEAARILQLGSASAKFHMESMTALPNGITTYSADNPVTDSAAGGTALATGHKANNYSLGINGNGRKVQTLAEKAKEEGKATGILTTKYMTDATPAAFLAHVSSRAENSVIAKSMFEARPNVLMGGFINEIYKESFSYPGYVIVNEKSRLDEAKDAENFIGMFSDHSMSKPQGDDIAPTLAEMTSVALDVLSKDRDGFFLMVEGGRIDTCSHDNNIVEMTKHLKAMDDAVKVALDFLKKNPDTLILVTADHETGGLKLPSNPSKSNLTNSCFTEKVHTAANVPLFYTGKLSEKLATVKDNTDVPKAISNAYGFANFPKYLD